MDPVRCALGGAGMNYYDRPSKRKSEEASNWLFPLLVILLILAWIF